MLEEIHGRWWGHHAAQLICAALIGWTHKCRCPLHARALGPLPAVVAGPLIAPPAMHTTCCRMPCRSNLAVLVETLTSSHLLPSEDV